MSEQPPCSMRVRGDTACVTLWYPRNSVVQYVDVDLCDVRAADSIRISYDFGRDGWKIEQNNVTYPPDGEGKYPVDDWQESAFVEAWARQVPFPWEEAYRSGAESRRQKSTVATPPASPG